MFHLTSRARASSTILCCCRRLWQIQHGMTMSSTIAPAISLKTCSALSVHQKLQLPRKSDSQKNADDLLFSVVLVTVTVAIVIVFQDKRESSDDEHEAEQATKHDHDEVEAFRWLHFRSPYQTTHARALRIRIHVFSKLNKISKHVRKLSLHRKRDLAFAFKIFIQNLAH